MPSGACGAAQPFWFPPPHAGEVARASATEGETQALILQHCVSAAPSVSFADSSPPPKSQRDFGQLKIAGREAAGGGGAK
jgi:hypothetical protein